MSRRKRSKRHPIAPGAPPGSLAHLPATGGAVKITAISFNQEQFTTSSIASMDEPTLNRRDDGVLWLKLSGIPSAELLAELGETFGLHWLTLEDMTHAQQRAKTERFPTYQYIVMSSPTLVEGEAHLSQLSLIVGDNFVITLEESDEGILTPIELRLEEGAGLVRGQSADYLAYTMIDSVLDHYFPILDQYDDTLDALEKAVIIGAGNDVLTDVYAFKESLRVLRRALWPVRDVISALSRDENFSRSSETRIHLRDCQDHVAQLIELIESARDTVTSLVELQMSTVGNKMNEIMKVLTMISTIFIPLSFLAGLYGMNFERGSSRWSMPELSWGWSYPTLLAIMLSIAIGLTAYFRRKGWLGERPRRADVKAG